MSRVRLVFVPVVALALLISSSCAFRSDLETGVSPDANLSDTTASDTTMLPDAQLPADSTPMVDSVAPRDTEQPPTDTSVSDTAPPFDGPLPNGVQCVNAVCAVGEVCCLSGSGAGVTGTCAASCPIAADGGPPVVTLGCDGTEDCASSGNVCCVEVALGAGAFPRCDVGGANTMCKPSAQCSYSVPFTCGASLISRACETSADCSAPATKCCDMAALGIDSKLCADALVSSFLGAACN